jgi:hypothetical protein
MDSINDCQRDQWITDNLAQGYAVCMSCFMPLGDRFDKCPNCECEDIAYPQSRVYIVKNEMPNDLF